MSKFDNHSEMVKTLTKSGAELLSKLTPEKVNLWHHVTGLAGESGELVDAIKKHAIYNKELDINNIIEELGDIEFYLEGIRSSLLISRDEVLQYNMAKLSKRYSEKYTDAKAQERADKNV